MRRFPIAPGVIKSGTERDLGDIVKISAIDAYGGLAEAGVSPTVQAGRYSFQAEAERRILDDILPKLRPEPHHRLLDIGCGAGALLIPLSYRMAEVVGVDHASAVSLLAARHQRPNMTLIAGAFPDVPIEGTFDRIIAYSVLICLPDLASVTAFSLAAAKLLRPGGRLLLADNPNRDRQRRWAASAAGRAAEQEWVRLKATLEGDDQAAKAVEHLSRGDQRGSFSDAELAALMVEIRAAGFEAYWVPQAPDLPFGRTREDIVVERV